MKTYKGMYIVRPDLTEDQIKAVIEDINKIFTDKGGELLNVKEWGMRDLAYEINDFKKGFYVEFTVNAEKESVFEFDRIANIKEEVIRHILINE